MYATRDLSSAMPMKSPDEPLLLARLIARAGILRQTTQLKQISRGLYHADL